MRILALEAYHGGSHRAFINGWAKRSRHEFTLLTLPARNWKWRMRHGAITFAEQARELVERGEAFDLVFANDMMNLAEFRGLAPAALRAAPAILYFHENQLTYPVPTAGKRDLHFAMINLLSAIAADAAWFNSAYHRDVFLDAGQRMIDRMPDHQPREATAAIRDRSQVQPPGVEMPGPREGRAAGPLRILWAARWEWDKNPWTFFEAIDLLADRGVDFRLSVIGRMSRSYPPVFDEVHRRHADRIDQWGWVEGGEAYREVLRQADVIVSTAKHEFFGIAVVEAVAAGALPLAPNGLAYPEVLAGREEFLYDGEAATLADRLAGLASRLPDLWQGEPDRGRRIVRQYAWPTRAAEMDEAADALASAASGASRSDP